MAEGRSFVFDHWGRTTVVGRLCFINEPYQNVEDAARDMLPLAHAP